MPKLLLCLWMLAAVSARAEEPSEKAKQILQKLQAKPRRSEWTFKTGYHPVLDRDVSEVTGLVEPEGWEKTATYQNAVMASALPAHWDWREQPNGLTPIKNQRNCGSCWAFGTVAVLENLVRIRDGVTTDVSEQQLLSCNKEGYSCNGGWFVHEYHMTPGAASGGEFPYVARDISCKSNLTFGPKIVNWGYVGGQNRKPTTEEIKQAIYTYGVVAVTVAASNSFQAYQSGIYNANDSSAINHLVNLVGWDDAGGYWIMRNSWGTEWGEDGYMRIKYGVNKIGNTTSFATYKTACSPQPIAYAGEDTTVRPGETIVLGGMSVLGQTYQWSPSTGLDNPNVAMPVARPTATTTYTVKVSNGCGTAEKSVRVLLTND